MSEGNADLIKVLKAEAEALDARRRELEVQAATIAQELEQTRKRQDLVNALMEASGYSVASARVALGQANSAPAPAVEIANAGSRRNVADIAHSILLARGKKPMYYEDLAAEVQKAGGVLGGVTPAQTLVARISRDSRFVRPEKRGWYAARDFYPKAKNVGARRISGKHSRKAGHS